jgi:hypothetical protein
VYFIGAIFAVSTLIVVLVPNLSSDI